MNKKGMTDELKKVLLMLAIVAIILGVILTRYFLEPSKDLGELLTCKGTPVGDGKCEETRSACTARGGTAFSGFGCKTLTPYCCVTTSSSADEAWMEVEGGGFNDCTWNPPTWTNPQKCQVSAVAARLMTQPKIGHKPQVRCYSNRIGVACFNTPTITLGGVPVNLDCKLDSSKGKQAMDDEYTIFNCDKPFADKGKYEITCTLNKDNCAIASGRDSARSGPIDVVN